MLTLMIAEASHVMPFEHIHSKQIQCVAGGELTFPKAPFRESGFGSTTYGVLGYRNVETQEPTDESFDLESRLAMLCDKLRARY